MGQLTKQDIQSLLDQARNRLTDKMISRQDVQTLTEASRDRIMTYVHDLVQIHQQNMMRRADVQNSQLTKRIAVMETRMISLEQELKLTRQALERLANNTGQQQAAATPQVQHVTLPKQSSVTPEQRYGSYFFQAD